MTKHEADVISGLNMTDQISNEAYKQIMIAAQDENEVGDVLDKIRAEIEQMNENTLKLLMPFDSIDNTNYTRGFIDGLGSALDCIDKYRNEVSE